MADYKRLYNTMKQMLDKYQNEIVPELRKEIEKIAKERDAAISDMGTLAEHRLNPCDVCKHLEPCDKPCERALQMDECFEWRGVCESNGGTP